MAILRSMKKRDIEIVGLGVLPASGTLEVPDSFKDELKQIETAVVNGDATWIPGVAVPSAAEDADATVKTRRQK